MVSAKKAFAAALVFGLLAVHHALAQQGSEESANEPYGIYSESDLSEALESGLFGGNSEQAPGLFSRIMTYLSLNAGQITQGGSSDGQEEESGNMLMCTVKRMSWAAGVIEKMVTDGLDDLSSEHTDIPEECLDGDENEGALLDLEEEVFVPQENPVELGDRADGKTEDKTGDDNKRHRLGGVDTLLVAAKYHYQKAEDLVRDGRFATAEASLDKSIDAKPTAAAHRLRAALRMKKGHMDEAIDDLSACVELEPGESMHYITRAVTMQLRGQHESAIEDYTIALNLDPNAPRIWGNRGLAWMRIGRNKRALEDLDKAISLWPDYPEGLYNRGVVRQKLQDLRGAEEDYLQALKVRPGWEEVEHNLNLVQESLVTN